MVKFEKSQVLGKIAGATRRDEHLKRFQAAIPEVHPRCFARYAATVKEPMFAAMFQSQESVNYYKAHYGASFQELLGMKDSDKPWKALQAHVRQRQTELRGKRIKRTASMVSQGCSTQVSAEATKHAKLGSSGHQHVNKVAKMHKQFQELEIDKSADQDDFDDDDDVAMT